MKQQRARTVSLAVVVLTGLVGPVPAHAQIRSLYPSGMNATNSGVLPQEGLTYQSLFQLYSFNRLKGINGESLPVNGKAAVFIDQNLFVWVSAYKLLGGTIAAIADVPVVANSSLTTVAFGTIAGGTGLADTFYQPFVLGWQLTRADLQAGYGIVAPTGRFTPGATDNIGSGFWGNFATAAQTVYLTASKGTAVSAWEGYEFNSEQKTTMIHPGQTFNVDYSLTQAVPLDKDMHTLLQLGLIGYGQYQTTDKSGPNVDPTIADSTRFKVNSLGVAGNILLPERKVLVGVKWFKEYSNRSTVQGQSLQIAASVTF
jgi:hypothetical protein